MKPKILLIIGITLLSISFMPSVTGCQPKESTEERPDLPRYASAHVSTGAINYLGASSVECHAYAQYEGDGIWKISISANCKTRANNLCTSRYDCKFAGTVLIYDETTGTFH
jgi:hypothetical protein